MLFIPELIYSISNSFYFYIVSSDLKLISIEKENFLNLIRENNQFKNGLIVKFLKMRRFFLQKLFNEKFNNNLNKEKLINNLSENISIIDEKIFKDIKIKN